MADHDPLCPVQHLPERLQETLWRVSACRCEEYARVRADERARIEVENYVYEETNFPTVAAFCESIEAEVRERIAQEIEEKADDWSDWDAIAKTEGDMLAIRDLVQDAIHDAAAIARGQS